MHERDINTVCKGLKCCVKENVSVAAAVPQCFAFLLGQRGEVGAEHPRALCRQQHRSAASALQKATGRDTLRIPPSTRRRSSSEPSGPSAAAQRHLARFVRPHCRSPLIYVFTSIPDCARGPHRSVAPRATSPRCRDAVGSGRCPERGLCADSGASRFGVLPRAPSASSRDPGCPRQDAARTARGRGSPSEAAAEGTAPHRRATPRAAPGLSLPLVLNLSSLQSSKRAVTEKWVYETESSH